MSPPWGRKGFGLVFLCLIAAACTSGSPQLSILGERIRPCASQDTTGVWCLEVRVQNHGNKEGSARCELYFSRESDTAQSGGPDAIVTLGPVLPGEIRSFHVYVGLFVDKDAVTAGICDPGVGG
jgi:hypothetical protein